MPRQYTPGPLPFVPFTQVEMTCEHCATRFLCQKWQSRTRRYCSQPCAQVASRTVATVPCPACGRAFRAKTKGATNQRHCSRACSLASARRPLDVARDFWPHLDQHGPIPPHRAELGPCWVWRGNIDPTHGYGYLWAAGDRHYVHRLSYTLAHGAIPPGLYVLHHCDNRRCGRPDHLFVGTFDDNMRDMREKGRSVGAGNLRFARQHEEKRVANLPRGSAHHRAKVTAEEVRVIRARLACGEQPAAIARDYPISNSMVSRIKRGRAWTHLE